MLLRETLSSDMNEQMVEIGNVIEGTVDRIEPYGLFLNHADGKVIVLAPEVSWHDHRNLRDRFKIGDVLRVRVLRYNYKDEAYVGSIRRLHPELNPYRELSRLRPGTVLEGKVTSLAGDEVTVGLTNGAFGHVPKHRAPSHWKRGQMVPVVITALEVDEGRLWLDAAESYQNKTVNGAPETKEKQPAS
jgi:small subunit ribosomal protein S1